MFNVESARLGSLREQDAKLKSHFLPALKGAER
jgi:hypothetical protein